MRFQEAYDAGKQRGLADSPAKLVCPDSGQVDEPLSPPLVTKRCRKRGKGNSVCIHWRIGVQVLTFGRKLVGGAIWPRS